MLTLWLAIWYHKGLVEMKPGIWISAQILCMYVRICFNVESELAIT